MSAMPKAMPSLAQKTVQSMVLTKAMQSTAMPLALTKVQSRAQMSEMLMAQMTAIPLALTKVH